MSTTPVHAFTDAEMRIVAAARAYADQVPEDRLAAHVLQALRDLSRDKKERKVRVGLPRHVTAELVSYLQWLTGNQMTQALFEELLQRDGSRRNARRYRNAEVALKFTDAYALLSLVEHAWEMRHGIFESHISITGEDWYLRLVALEVMKEWERDNDRRQRQAKKPRANSPDDLPEVFRRFRESLRDRATIGAALMKQAGCLPTA